MHQLFITRRELFQISWYTVIAPPKTKFLSEPLPCLGYWYLGVSSFHQDSLLYGARNRILVFQIKGGVLILGWFCTLLYVAGTMHSVLIKGGVLISGYLCSYNSDHSQYSIRKIHLWLISPRKYLESCICSILGSIEVYIYVLYSALSPSKRWISSMWVDWQIPLLSASLCCKEHHVPTWVGTKTEPFAPHVGTLLLCQ